MARVASFVKNANVSCLIGDEVCLDAPNYALIL